MNSATAIARALFVAAIIGSMTFGAQEALAAKATAPCYDPPDWLGECLSQGDCDLMCSAAGGIEGECHPNGCCACAY